MHPITQSCRLADLAVLCGYHCSWMCAMPEIGKVAVLECLAINL